MKNKFIPVVAVIFITGITSCKKSFMEQSSPNSVNIEQGMNTEADVALAVNGAYEALRSSNCIGEEAILWTDDRSDDYNSTDNQSNSGDPFQFTAFALAPINPYLYNHWVALYNPIVRANVVLSQIDKISFANESTKTQYIAEMKFIRAVMYFMLVREFGDVPVVTERLTNPEQVEALTYRRKREEVYAQIFTDLKDVTESNLPVIQPASGKGRASLQAANAMLGKAYLTAAASGVDAANATANLNNAKNYLMACYNQKTFAKLSDIPFADVFDVAKEATNPEIIWQISYKQGDPTYSSAIARNNQATGENTNSLFVSTGTGRAPTLDLVKEFEANDIRKNFTFKYAAHPSVQNNYITKFRDASSAASNLGRGGNDWILMRYADVVLCLAEVSMLLNDEANAIVYLDMVRSRAGLPGYTAMQGDAGYKAKFPTLKLAILHERRMELAFEHHRWHDLVRFFTPEQLVAYFKQKSQADYNNSPLSNIGTKDYYFPIPLDENKLDPEKMYQNPGYE